MARVKKTSRAPPASSNRGLAGFPRLDPAFPQPYRDQYNPDQYNAVQYNPNQYNLHHLSQSFWVPPNPFDPDFDTLRDFDKMPPPPSPPAASEQDIGNDVLGGNYDQVLERTAMAGADTLTQPFHKKRKITDADLEESFVSQPSRSSTDSQIRISALQSTLRILQDKKKELEGGSAITKRAPDSEEGRKAAEPETKDRPRHVTFVNYDAKQKEKMEHVEKRIRTSKKEFEVAKEEDDVEEMKRLAGKMERFEEVLTELKEHEAEREAAGEGEDDDDGDDEGEAADLPMSGMEE